jgi:nucleoside-diphosphate-sugar epimerase
MGRGDRLMRLFCFGFGYTAESLARRLSARLSALAGTRTSLPEGGEGPLGARLAEFKGDTASAEVRERLQDATHVLVSIPPDVEGDPALRLFREDLASLQGLAWIGYLSTVGVYGDWQGQWVDETAPPRPISERSLRRLQAERAWAQFGRDSGRRVEIFRLAGIYGPGRSVIDGLRAGTARRIVKPGQFFNRIHVDDIAEVLAAAIDKQAGHGIYNVGDDEPAPPQDVVAYAAELLGLPIPPEVPFEKAALTAMAATFWAENKRVSNARIKRDLDVELLYPSYREGLRALVGG